MLEQELTTSERPASEALAKSLLPWGAGQAAALGCQSGRQRAAKAVLITAMQAATRAAGCCSGQWATTAAAHLYTIMGRSDRR